MYKLFGSASLADGQENKTRIAGFFRQEKTADVSITRTFEKQNSSVTCGRGVAILEEQKLHDDALPATSNFLRCKQRTC